jgi:hypothetical protein
MSAEDELLSVHSQTSLCHQNRPSLVVSCQGQQTVLWGLLSTEQSVVVQLSRELATVAPQPPLDPLLCQFLSLQYASLKYVII